MISNRTKTLISLVVACATFACSSVPAGVAVVAVPQRAAPLVDGPGNDGAVAFDTTISPALDVKRVRTGHLLVRPKINGRDAGYFIFDTGAGICVVSTPEVEALGIEAAGDIEALGIGGATSAKTFRADTVELGPMTLRDHPLMATDLTFLEKHLGEKIAGVIGYGVLSRCVAEMDFVAPRVALHDPTTYELVGAEWSELDLSGRTPAIRARFEGKEGLFQLDTGANSAVAFHEPAVRKWKLIEGRAVTDSKLGGVGGFIASKNGVLEWFEFGGVRQEKVEAVFPMEAKGARASSSRDGAIGAALLRPFVMVTDYRHERIAFRAREEASAAAVGR